MPDDQAVPFHVDREDVNALRLILVRADVDAGAMEAPFHSPGSSG